MSRSDEEDREECPCPTHPGGVCYICDYGARQCTCSDLDPAPEDPDRAALENLEGGRG